MAGTEEKDVTIIYVDGTSERFRAWLIDEIEKTDLNQEWLDSWDDADFLVFGLDECFDDHVCINLRDVRSLTVRTVPPQDEVSVPPIDPESYATRDLYAA